jgi:hypothetical protein
MTLIVMFRTVVRYLFQFSNQFHCSPL